MLITEKQKVYLRILSYLTDELYDMYIETYEEAEEILKEHKEELEERISVKYFTDRYEERVLLMEIYIDECYVFLISCYCKEKVKSTDTIHTVDIISFGSYA